MRAANEAVALARAAVERVARDLVEQVVETLLVELGQVLRYALARAPGGRSADRLEGRARKTLGWRRGGVLRSRRS